jgi:signal transduction histidine kinase
VARTAAALRLWQSWRAGELADRGRLPFVDTVEPVLAVWAGGPDRPVAWFATSSDLDAAFGPLATASALRIAGHDATGHLLFGDTEAGAVSLMPSDTRLPFALSVRMADAAPAVARDRMRRTVLAVSLFAAFLLMIAAAYGVYRATARELGLARQQTDFVSAVSHEFRTPLTSMRHLTDMLATRGVESEEWRAHYYALLAHETERLHRMVESLLSFGQIEAGGYAFRLEPLDAGALLAGLVNEFRLEPMAKTRDVLCEVEPSLPAIRADAEALTRALWNLLENAAKYSAPDAPVRAFARRAGTAVYLGVADQGVGIEPRERGRIFEKFVRGADAKRTGVRGVGIGLSLVKRIVDAHGGSVRVDSAPGRGSTFTLVIPCLES